MSENISRELSEELYKLSGWEDTSHYYDVEGYVLPAASVFGKIPAYDLGYLLRKLPVATYVRKNLSKPRKKSNWRGEYTAAFSTGFTANYREYADTPEDAVCKLAIELIRQGIIKPEAEEA